MRPFWYVRAGRAITVAGIPSAAMALAAMPAIAATTPTHAVAPASVQSPVAQAARAKVSIRHRRLNVVAGRHTSVSGRLVGRGSGHVVLLQRTAAHGRWVTMDRDATNHAGRFRLSSRVSQTGTTMLRVRVRHDRVLRSSVRSVGHLNVFRAVNASWYGPGFFGGPLACGGSLGFTTMGVANKTLPCGTKVTLRYHGRAVHVRVIDRGPYVAGREYDLTQATKTALHFGDVGTLLATH
jgi:rare lipoprotein A